MKALRLIDWKSEPELVEVSKPMPAPGEVVIKIGGAGACHSDLHLMHDFEAGIMPWQMPFTLGHENAGWVDSIGSGVTNVSEGDAVAVYGAWVCSKCSRCQQGFENYCENPAEAPVFSGGSNSPVPPPAPSVTPPSSASQAPRFSCRSSRSPNEVSIQTTYWGSRPELVELLGLAARDLVHAESTTYPLDDAAQAYRDLHQGKVHGRAVVLP